VYYRRQDGKSIEGGKKAVGTEGGPYTGGSCMYDQGSWHEETRKLAKLGKSSPEEIYEI
jgi:hypothetical protein